VKIFHKYNLKYSEVAQSVAVGWKTGFDSQQDRDIFPATTARLAMELMQSSLHWYQELFPLY
jgi:hypothetical protein